MTGYILAALEILTVIGALIYFLANLALGEERFPLWAIILIALAFWAAAFELIRHAVELARKQRGISREH